MNAIYSLITLLIVLKILGATSIGWLPIVFVTSGILSIKFLATYGEVYMEGLKDE